MQGKERIDQAVATREREEAALHREDGAKLYASEEHADRLEAIGARFTATMDSIEGDIARRLEKSQEDILVAENADPTSILNGGELESANARRAFVTDEVYTLDLERLADRCRAVRAQGDRPVMFLYALYAGQRVGETMDPAGDYLNLKHGADTATGGATEQTGAQRVREAVAEIRADLDPDGQKERAAARKAVEEAEELKNYAYLRRRGVRSAAELYLNQTYGR